MEGKKKLNLNALINKGVNEDSTNTPKDEKQENNISLDSKLENKNNIDISNEENKKIKDEKNKQIETRKKKISINIPSETKIEKEKVDKKKDIEIKKEIEKPKEVEKKEENELISKIDVKDEIEKNKTEDGEIFSNYKSEFHGKEHSVIEKIKKLKNMPKTNFIFLGILIIITSLMVSGVFKFFPEQHSVDKYKASIIDVYNQVTPSKETPWAVQFRNVKGVEITIEYKTNKDGKVIYKYNNNIYSDENTLQDAIINKIKKLQEEKRIKKEKETKRKILDFFLKKD